MHIGFIFSPRSFTSKHSNCAFYKSTNILLLLCKLSKLFSSLELFCYLCFYLYSRTKGEGRGLLIAAAHCLSYSQLCIFQNSSVKMKEVALLRWLHIKCWRDKVPICHSGPVSEPFLPATYTIKSFPSTASSYVLRVRKEPIAMSLHKFMAHGVAKPPSQCLLRSIHFAGKKSGTRSRN